MTSTGDTTPPVQQAGGPGSGLPTRVMTRVGLETPSLAFGGAPLGNLFRSLSEDQAATTIRTALEGGVRLFDTAPWYGHGLSEHRLGHELRRVPRSMFLLSTKVGRVYSPLRGVAAEQGPWVDPLPFSPRFDYTHSGIQRSYEDSLMRLGLDRVDLLVVHDLDRSHHGPSGLGERLKELESSGWARLEHLRDQGEVRAIGAGVNEAEMVVPLLDRFDLDFLLVAMPYTLIDQQLLGEPMERCAARGVNLLIGSPFASGILATGAQTPGHYGYAQPTPEIIEHVGKIEEVCERHSVPLRAAALQFPLGHPLVVAVVTGATSATQVEDNLTMMAVEIPPVFWADLKAAGLLAADVPVGETSRV